MPRERILIVEDEAIVQLHLQRIVEDAGFEVVGVASTGEQALARAAGALPDVVLMDIRLAGALDGIETGVRLRAVHDAALIFVTADANDATLARATETVPLGYVVKPFERDDIRAAIASALAQRAALRGARGPHSARAPRRDDQAPAGGAPPLHAMVGQGEITADHLPPEIAGPSEAPDDGRGGLDEALKNAQGIHTGVAEVARLMPRRLYRRLAKLLAPR